jgi:DNA topoisomerase-3
MKLIIAEKPMLGKDIAKAMCGAKDNVRLPFEGGGYAVVNCVGHILELSDPAEIDEKWQKPWREESLPIYIEPWPKRPAKGKEELVETIGRYLEKCDSVIHAGDPDDEGQLLVDEVLDYLGYEGRVERVYVNDNIEKNIKKAFERLIDNAECRKHGDGAHARQIADACFGYNETRLATTRLNRLMSVGRVQTPTLGLVVARDAAIENHERTRYFELIAEGDIDGGAVLFKFTPGKDMLDDSNSVLVGKKRYAVDADILKPALERIAFSEGKAQNVTTTVEAMRKAAPLPYNLTMLIADMSRRFKYGAQKTQDITQTLKDRHRAITYNRTDCPYLKDKHFEDAPKVCVQAMANCGLDWPLDFTIKSKAFNDKNVSVHHGIIPQDIELDLSQMTEEERNVYAAVCERYALQFLPLEASEVSSTTFEFPEGRFEYRVRRVADAGWKRYAKAGPDDEGADEEGTDGDDGKTWVDAGEHTCIIKKDASSSSIAHAYVTESYTNPPKPYTEGTLIADMASVARYVKDERIREILKKKDDGKKGEHGGIGTTATRASIIEKLKERGYIEDIKGRIRATKLGCDFFNLLPDVIKRPDTTALWWLIQQDIVEGKKDVYEIERSVIKVFQAHKDTSYKGAAGFGAKRREAAGVCPKCGEGLLRLDSSYSCSSNRNEKQDDGTWARTSGCGFRMWDSAFKKRLTESNVADLLEKGVTTGKVEGLKKKKGGVFSAKLALDRETGDISPVFD